MDLGLRDKVALVAGSTSGLGRAVAQTLAAEGARVAVTGRRADAAAELAATLPGAAGFETDLVRPASATELSAAVVSELGPIDVLVLNAGGPKPAAAGELDADDVRAATETLLVRQLELAAAALPAMRARGWGRIVAIGSSGVQQPLAGLALSNIARAGLAGYLKTLAAEVAVDGVTVNMVLPGRIDTARVAALDQARADRDGTPAEEVRARSQATIPMGRYGGPQEFAAVVAFLCGVPASYVTGEQVRCDGGLVGGY